MVLDSRWAGWDTSPLSMLCHPWVMLPLVGWNVLLRSVTYALLVASVPPISLPSCGATLASGLPRAACPGEWNGRE